MLIVFSGLPGTGKTTIAQKLTVATRAACLRIDTIEQAILNAEGHQRAVGRTGYLLANELALSNLCLGNTVIVDCVNPVAESRNAWQEVAVLAQVQLFNVQVVCSNAIEHQRRVEQRQPDIADERVALQCDAGTFPDLPTLSCWRVLIEAYTKIHALASSTSIRVALRGVESTRCDWGYNWGYFSSISR
ncbi:AAA family ATPase [Pseudomonas sp. dw_358]|uniref:AAA family ATPase n=1 Tax=Pseudomonas sp. dw_358 TaxID=2720083 RepID=UPI001BD3AE66|nr:AAA family ATPase [Pseudomonas sp. dw_358]